MTEQHPITPPPELVKQWKRTAPHQSNEHEHYHYITLCAAQWGADQELEACCEWMADETPAWYIDALRAYRRPMTEQHHHGDTMTDTTRDLHPMTNQIPIEEALKLVDFEFIEGAWRVMNVKCDVGGYVKGNVGSVYGNVEGNVEGDVYGNVEGNVNGKVWGNVGSVYGDVCGTIKGRKWQFVETPKEKLKRLIQEDADKDQLLEAFNQLEESDD